MNIAQISQLEGRGAPLLAAMLEQVPVLRAAQFKQDASTHFVVPDKSGWTGSAARAKGSAAQRDFQNNDPVSRNLALYDRELAVDEVYQKDLSVGMSPAGLRMFLDRQLKALAVKLSEEIEGEMWNGTDADNRMLGISEFVKDADAAGQTARLGFTTDELAAMNVQYGDTLDTEAKQNAFVEMLEREMANVPGVNAIVVNAYLKARLSTIARRQGSAGETKDSFGKPVQTFNGVPIIPVSNSTITQTESDGTNSDNTSLYLLRFQEDLGTCFSTNTGFKFKDFDLIDDVPADLSRLGIYLNLTVEKTNALRRISRIRLG